MSSSNIASSMINSLVGPANSNMLATPLVSYLANDIMVQLPVANLDNYDEIRRMEIQ